MHINMNRDYAGANTHTHLICFSLPYHIDIFLSLVRIRVVTLHTEFSSIWNLLLLLLFVFRMVMNLNTAHT